MYLTYQEYKDMGGTLDETAFDDFEFRARASIDWYTFNRLQNETTYPEVVKRCMFSLINLLVNATLAGATSGENTPASGVVAGVASQSNDGVSISFNTLSAKDALDASKAEITETIERYLQGVINSLGHKVLYRGVYPDE